MTADVELAITGMTCASCATRIERKLNKLDGVVASVNYATEKAKVTYPESVSTDDLLRTVEQAGYDAALPRPAAEPAPRTAATGLDPALHRLLVSAALTIPVIAMAMVPRLQVESWQWLSLTLATPVVFWGGWQFHRAAALNLRHGTTTMDTLVSLGTLAAYGWSVYALFWGTAGTPGHDPSLRADHRALGRRRQHLLRGRRRRDDVPARRSLAREPREAPGRRRAARAHGAGRQGRGRPARRRRGARPRRRARVRRPLRRPARREDRDRRRRRVRHVGDRRRHAHRRVRAGRGRSRRRRRRRDRQRRRTSRRAGDPGRRRHAAGPDGPAGRGGPARQGRGAAAGRPGLGVLRAGRDRPRRRHPGLLARHRHRRERGHDRGRGRPDHRLPLRAGPGHADGADGRAPDVARSSAS